MFTTTKTDSSNRITSIIFGESGSGKTTLISTLPGKTLIYNAENGLLSLARFSIDVYDGTVDKNGKSLSRVQRFEKLMHFLANVFPELNGKYDNLVFDSLTEIAQNLVEYLKSKYDESSGFKMWGEYNDRMTDLIKTLRDYKKYNIIFLALDSIDKDESGRRFTGIDINGKIAHRLPALLDEVFYLKVMPDDEGKLVRKIITSGHQGIIAKDRSGKLDLFEQPDLTKIITKIQGAQNAIN